MTSKELVYRAIEFRNPDRLPINYCNRDFEHSDTIATSYNQASGFVPVNGRTEWGYKMHSLDNTMGQPEGCPLLDACAIAGYRSPDPYAPGRLDHIQDFIDQNADKFIKFSMGISGFNHATFLRGFEEFFVDLYTDQSLADRVLDIIFTFENGILDQLKNFGIDAVTFYDDWGTQRSLMISPELWREVFKPRYEQQFNMIHEAGMKVWFHSCGYVYDIIGDLIEIGADVIELLQPDLFGVEKLGDDFGGKVSFCCSVDHQRRAISGTRNEIFDYARLLNDTLGKYSGGFIAYIEDYSSLGMSEQNYQWIRQAFSQIR